MRAILKFGVTYWAVVFAIAFGLGAVRTLLIEPRIGATAAVLLELPLMLATSYLVAHALLARNPLALDQRVMAGGIAFVLLMMAEAALAATLSRISVADWAVSLFRMPGMLGLAGQLGFAAMPALVAKGATA